MTSPFICAFGISFVLTAVIHSFHLPADAQIGGMGNTCGYSTINYDAEIPEGCTWGISYGRFTSMPNCGGCRMSGSVTITCEGETGSPQTFSLVGACEGGQATLLNFPNGTIMLDMTCGVCN